MTQSGYINPILEWVNSSNDITRYISRLVPIRYREDMKQHLIIEISKVRPDKLITMYSCGTLRFLAFRIIKNQMDPDCTNCFFRIHMSLNRNTQDTQDRYHELNELSWTGDPIHTQTDIYMTKVAKIENTLRYMKPWKVNLFNMYYRDGYNLREISEKVDMNIATVKSWIYEVRDELKNKLTK